MTFAVLVQGWTVVVLLLWGISLGWDASPKIKARLMGVAFGLAMGGLIALTVLLSACADAPSEWFR